jgi:TatD DNase family protein
MAKETVSAPHPEGGAPFSIIDTHCHLDMSLFDDDRDMVVQRARDAGVTVMVTIGSDLGSCKAAVGLSESFEDIYCSVGVHPHDAKDFSEDVLNRLSEWTMHEKVVAIGETGLDYHYDNSPRDVQRRVMIRHLRLAVEKGLPAIIHSREAKEDTIRILEDSGIRKGVLHCFSGDMEMAEAAISMGLLISIAGPVTFRKSTGLRDIVKAIPDGCLLVETDSPYLSPEPFRGRRNEPAFVLHTAREVARVRGVALEDIARITTLNAVRLFGLESPSAKGVPVYRIRDSLYLNITNRCTNSCSFCIRFHSDFVKGHNLRLREEPSLEELKAGISGHSDYEEVVFCGYGEPTLRLDLVKRLSAWIKQGGGRVRLNTNGHGNMINARNIIPELKGLVDSISVSLDAHDSDTYNGICRPDFDDAFEGVLSFIREAKRHIPEVQATVVEMDGVDMDKCAEIASGLGVRLRVRKLDAVG